MKHLKKMSTLRPQPAQINTGTIFTVLSQIMQVVGAMLIEKRAMEMDPYDY